MEDDEWVSITADATELTCTNTDVEITSTVSVQGTASYLWSNGETTQSIDVTDAGSYTVTVTDTGFTPTDGVSCTASDSGTVTVNPAVTVSVNSVDICAGDTATLKIGRAACRERV